MRGYCITIYNKGKDLKYVRLHLIDDELKVRFQNEYNCISYTEWLKEFDQERAEDLIRSIKQYAIQLAENEMLCMLQNNQLSNETEE